MKLRPPLADGRRHLLKYAVHPEWLSRPLGLRIRFDEVPW